MDTLTFVSEIVKAVMSLLAAWSWPVCVLLIVLLLRQYIEGVISRIERFKYAGLEVELGSDIKEIEQKSEEVAEEVSETIGSESIEPRWVVHTKEMADRSPTIAILTAWGSIKNSIDVAMRRAYGKPYRSGDVIKSARQLLNDRYITMSQLELIEAMQHLRNKIGAGKDVNLDSVISEDYVKSYIDATGVLVNSLWDIVGLQTGSDRYDSESASYDNDDEHGISSN